MVEPDIKIGESDASAVISIPPGWKTDIVYTFKQAYKQGISETYPSEGDPDDEQFNYHLNDKVGELGTSTIFPRKDKFNLSLGFRHERSQDPSTKLGVLKEIGSDSLTFTILSRDKPGSTCALDISTSDMYAKIHLLNTTPPPQTGPGHAESASESELTAPKKGAQTLDDFSKDSGIDPDKLIPGPLYHPPPELKDLPIAIIGAGAAGLYTAMILDSLGIKYEILEGSGRH